MAHDVKTAVIAAAGHATRMWPASKVLPKELFPLGRIPAIVHLVWELVDAGIRRVILVVGRQAARPIEMLLDRSIRPPTKIADDPVVRQFEVTLAETDFVILHQSGPYGNAVPLLLAAHSVGPEPCIYAFGDDIVLGENVTKGLLKSYFSTGCPVLAAQHIESHRIPLFGILECWQEGGFEYVSRLIEKPSPGQTLSDLASFGRYLVTPDLMDTLRTITPSRDGELWFVDAVIRRINNGERVCAFTLTSGKWYTVGDPLSYAEAVKAATETGFYSASARLVG
ncbi:MAG: sugar phosphate nucleotidyltransferase [Planctomycetota bacterium]|mgnify:FL=1